MFLYIIFINYLKIIIIIFFIIYNNNIHHIIVLSLITPFVFIYINVLYL